MRRQACSASRRGSYAAARCPTRALLARILLVALLSAPVAAEPLPAGRTPDGHPATAPPRGQASPGGTTAGATAALLAALAVGLAWLRRARDAAERARASEQIRHLQDVIVAVRAVSGMLVRETERQRMLQRTCELLEHRPAYRLIWIGVVDEEATRLVPSARAGADAGALATETAVAPDGTPERESPAATAARTRRPCIVRPALAGGRAGTWRATALAHGVQAIAAIPIVHGERLHGVLTVHAAHAGAFDEEERALLIELAADLAHALWGLETRAEKERATARLRESEDRYRRLSEELEQRVAERTAALDVANRDLEAFNHSVSHDLRTPLWHILEFARILREEHGATLPEDGRRWLDDIETATLRMRDTIDTLLEVSRVGRAALHPQAVDLAALARAAFADARTDDGRPVELVVDPLPPVVGDPLLLRHVFDNLLGNALKFTRGCPLARITVGSCEHGGAVVFYVRDNGAGFDQARAGELFGAFQRLHAQSEFEGTGLGLTIVKRIVEKHDGRVWAEGVPGAGATFFFTLGTTALAAAA